MHALVSRSTRGIRALLRGEQQAMEFAMPLAPAGTETAIEPRIQKELDELGQVDTSPLNYLWRPLPQLLHLSVLVYGFVEEQSEKAGFSCCRH